MREELKKEGIYHLELSPHLKPISNEDIGFYNLDKNTSVLTFQVTKNNKPLLISDKNTIAYVYLESDNGNNQIIEDMKYVDAFKGLIAFQVPNEFLKSSTGTQVTGQIYISVNQKNDTPQEKSDTAVLTEFTFSVKDALINAFDGAEKVKYIRMFDDLKGQVTQQVSDIDEKVKHLEDYVTKVTDASEEGKQQIEQSRINALKRIDTAIGKGNNQIEEIKNAAIKRINIEADDKLEAIESLSEEKLKAIRVDKEIIEQFSQSIQSETEQLMEEIKKKATQLPTDINGWQKYKLTEDNGTIQRIDEPDMQTMEGVEEPGFYYIFKPQNFIDSSNGYLIIYQRSSYIKAIFHSYNRSNVYVNSKLNNEWIGWERANQPKDTGWQDLVLKNDHKAYENVGYQSGYRVVDYGTYKVVYVRLAVTNVRDTFPVVASLPKEFNPHPIHGAASTTNTKIPPKVYIKNGDIKIYTNKNDKYEEDTYVVYNDNWII